MVDLCLPLNKIYVGLHHRQMGKIISQLTVVIDKTVMLMTKRMQSWE